MRVLILNPPPVGGNKVVREERYEHRDIGACYPPLDLLRAGGVLRRLGHEALLIDANAKFFTEEELFKRAAEFEPQAIVSRVGFDTQNQDAEFLARVRWVCDAPLIIRNRILAESEEYLQRFLSRHRRFDFFCREPFCESLPRVLSQFEREQRPRISESISSGPESSPIAPDYSLLDNLDGYHTGIFDKDFCVVQASSGCPSGCRFCAYGRSPYRERRVDEVLKDMDFLKTKFGLRRALFFDDNFAMTPERAIELSESISRERFGIAWAACLRPDAAGPEALKAMKRAGCVELALGVESGDPKVLEQTGKGITTDQIRSAARACHQAGILLYSMVILGLPGENNCSIENTIALIREIRPFYTQYCFSTPFPNTYNYVYYKENDLLLSEEPERFFPLAPEPVIRTKELSAPELKRWRRKAFRAANLGPGHLLRQVRVLDWGWNIRGLKAAAQRVSQLRRDEPMR